MLLSCNIHVINDFYIIINIVDVATLADIGGVSGTDLTGWSVIQNLGLRVGYFQCISSKGYVCIF